MSEFIVGALTLAFGIVMGVVMSVAILGMTQKGYDE